MYDLKHIFFFKTIPLLTRKPRRNMKLHSEFYLSKIICIVLKIISSIESGEQLMFIDLNRFYQEQKNIIHLENRS